MNTKNDERAWDEWREIVQVEKEAGLRRFRGRDWNAGLINAGSGRRAGYLFRVFPNAFLKAGLAAGMVLAGVIAWRILAPHPNHSWNMETMIRQAFRQNAISPGNPAIPNAAEAWVSADFYWQFQRVHFALESEGFARISLPRLIYIGLESLRAGAESVKNDRKISGTEEAPDDRLTSPFRESPFTQVIIQSRKSIKEG
jgi:hypothetical protein